MVKSGLFNGLGHQKVGLCGYFALNSHSKIRYFDECDFQWNGRMTMENRYRAGGSDLNDAVKHLLLHGDAVKCLGKKFLGCHNVRSELWPDRSR